jgi:aminopeptidase-like protein
VQPLCSEKKERTTVKEPGRQPIAWADWTRADSERLADEALRLIREIFPICRSITGDGVRRTLDAVSAICPIQRVEVPTGERIFDWRVPAEWNIRDGWVADRSGRRRIDFRRNALHVLGYSRPIRARMPLRELRGHLHTLPSRPDWIPYRTSYFREDWGFCLSQNDLDGLEDDVYEVVIDSTLAAGSLTFGESRAAGEGDEEFLIFTHTCHPSLANDNATGIGVAAVLARELAARATRLSYRFVFAPATLGAIAWLARNESAARALRGGLVVGLLGDPGPLTYKRSRRRDTEIDRIAASVVGELSVQARVEDFSPWGYAERQLCSPGFDLAVGRLTRSPHDAYAEYHTSADDLSLISREALAESIQAILTIVGRLDRNRRFRNRSPNGEPQLGVRGLLRSLGGESPGTSEQALLWMLSQSDGQHGIVDTAAISGLPRSLLEAAASALVDSGLLEELDPRRAPSGPVS